LDRKSIIALFNEFIQKLNWGGGGNSVPFTHYFVNYEMTQTGIFNYFRIYVSSFDEMQRRLKERLQRRNGKMRNCIQPVEMSAVAVR
jgi:oligoribonuclease (3'-5' exoribonuclease)